MPLIFQKNSSSRRTTTANANGIISPVTGAGIVTLSLTLSLHNTFLVPSLSYKLLSASQISIDLNCVVLIYLTFYLLQDILTKEIIGHGTKKGELYYMDDLSVGQAHHVHHYSNIKEQQIWLWHRRLGHLSFGYIKHLFPNLFTNMQFFYFKCDTCILAKSHRTIYH